MVLEREQKPELTAQKSKEKTHAPSTKDSQEQ